MPSVEPSERPTNVAMPSVEPTEHPANVAMPSVRPTKDLTNVVKGCVEPFSSNTPYFGQIFEKETGASENITSHSGCFGLWEDLGTPHEVPALGIEFGLTPR